MAKRKILAVFANPHDTGALALDEERRAIEHCLDLSRKRPFELKVCSAARADDLLRFLLEEKPEIVHVSGHGSADGLLLVHDRDRSAHTIDPSGLSAMLAAHGVRVAVLNACYSSVHADELARMNVPYVVAMSDEISDEAAIRFTRGFYTALAAERDVETAFGEGVRNMKLVAATESEIPRLWVHPGAPVAVKSRIRKAVGAAAALIALLTCAYLYMRPTIAFAGVTADHKRLKFKVSEHWPGRLRFENFNVSARDQELASMRFGPFLAPQIGADGVLEVGIAHLVADAGKLSQFESKELTIQATAVDKTTKLRFVVADDITLAEILSFVRKRGSHPDMVAGE